MGSVSPEPLRPLTRHVGRLADLPVERGDHDAVLTITSTLRQTR